MTKGYYTSGFVAELAGSGRTFSIQGHAYGAYEQAPIDTFTDDRTPPGYAESLCRRWAAGAYSTEKLQAECREILPKGASSEEVRAVAENQMGARAEIKDAYYEANLDNVLKLNL